MFIDLAKLEVLRTKFGPRLTSLLLQRTNLEIQTATLDPAKRSWLEQQNQGIKESIIGQVVQSDMKPLTVGLQNLQKYNGVLPRPEDVQDCIRLIEALVQGNVPVPLQLDPACAVVSIVSPAQTMALRGFLDALTSPTEGLRREAQNRLRGDDLVYTDGQGAIPARFIRLNREAIRSLVMDIGNSHAMFSMERGGALVADHISNLTKRGIFNFKVPKLNPADVDKAVIPTPRDSWSIYKLRFENPAYSRDEHARRFRAQIDQVVQAASGIPITICLVESLVGGASARKILDQAQSVLRDFPNVRIRVLLERHTIHHNAPQGAMVERFQPHLSSKPFMLFEGRSEALSLALSSVPPPYHLTGPRDPRPAYDPSNLRADVTVARADYIIGEDVNYQISYEGEDVRRPVVIFDENPPGTVRALQLVPRGPMTARDILQRLIEGVYDQVLASYGIRLLQ